jgi:CIC family chloride channel protein
MPGPLHDFLKAETRALRRAADSAGQAIGRHGRAAVGLWLIALGLGIAAGFAAVGFRLTVEAMEGAIYGSHDMLLADRVGRLPWPVVLLAPAIGGLIVGIILNRYTPDGAVRSVADVIEAAARRKGRVDLRAGLGSAAASMITLSSGGSTGREGPVVHLAAVLSSWVSNRIGADGVTGRDLLGCAVAAAVAASFNAPIAGMLFAHEVILRHFALHAFAPIAIAAVSGAVVSRLVLGGGQEFAAPGDTLNFYTELPAFLILGLVCGLVAAATIRAVFLADDFGTALSRATGLPARLRPALAGLLLGLIALWYPHVIGVGQAVTLAALNAEMLLGTAIAFCVIKIVAVAITMAGRMGGGIFSPSLMIGALTGLAFGLVATAILPEQSSPTSLYALAGTGAVAAAVLGAPISTTMIVFELTGEWQTGIAVMVSVSLSTAIASRLVARSFFLTQLERQSIRMAAGPQSWLLATLPVADVLRPPPEDAAARAALLAGRERLSEGDTLEEAMPLFEATGAEAVAVVRAAGGGAPPELVGVLHQIDALRAFNRALARQTAEEHS